MGLLDFLETPQGQALASGVATYAANARRGQPINSLGRGALGAFTGYGEGMRAQQESAQQKQKDAYNKRQQDLLEMHYGNESMRAQSERAKLMQQKNSERANSKFMLPGFLKAAGVNNGYDIDEEGELVPVGNTQPMPVSVDWMGDTGDEYKSMIAQGLQSEDQFTRRQALKEAFGYYKSQRTNTKEAKDAIAKDRAIAEAMGMNVGDYLRQKMNKSGVNVTVQNYGEPKPVQMPDGTQGLVRFGKSPNDAPIVVPYQPPASDTEQQAAGYANRMMESEKIIQGIGNKGFPTVSTEMAGALGNYPQRLMMTPDQQMHRQAQEDWVRSKLRKESGAVIADDEMEREINVYFPKPGDSSQVIEQKRRSRDTAIKAMNKTAGPAMTKQEQAPQKPQAAPKSTTFDMLPNASKYDGKTIRDDVSGKRYTSKGGKWVEVK